MDAIKDSIDNDEEKVLIIFFLSFVLFNGFENERGVCLTRQSNFEQLIKTNLKRCQAAELSSL